MVEMIVEQKSIVERGNLSSPVEVGLAGGDEAETELYLLHQKREGKKSLSATVFRAQARAL